MFIEQSELQKINEAIKKYPEKQSALMDSLHIIQNKFRYIPEEAVLELSEILAIPIKDITGVVSFYTMFTDKALGKYHIQVCTNVSCMLNKGKELFEYISQKIQLNHLQTSTDGFVSLEEVECMGACGGAPMIAINDKYYEFVDKFKFDKLYEELSKDRN